MAEQAIPANCTDSNNPTWGVLSRSYALLSKAGNGNGPWLDTRILKQSTAHVKGTFGGGTVQLMASNDPDPVVSGDAGIAIGAAASSAGFISITGPYRWVRAVVNGGTNPSINAVLHGVA